MQISIVYACIHGVIVPVRIIIRFYPSLERRDTRVYVLKNLRSHENRICETRFTADKRSAIDAGPECKL